MNDQAVKENWQIYFKKYWKNISWNVTRASISPNVFWLHFPILGFKSNFSLTVLFVILLDSFNISGLHTFAITWLLLFVSYIKMDSEQLNFISNNVKLMQGGEKAIKLLDYLKNRIHSRIYLFARNTFVSSDEKKMVWWISG